MFKFSMNSSFKIVTFLLVNLFIYINISYADRLYTGSGFVFEPATNISFTIEVLVNYDLATQKYSYNYKFTLLPDSVQELFYMKIEYRGEQPTVIVPTGWDGESSKYTVDFDGQIHASESVTPNNMYFISWGKSDFIFPPGSSQDNLKIDNCSLPGIVNYYVKGIVEMVIFPDEEPGYEPPEISDFYQNSVNGKTLGPVDPPATPFDGVAFSDTIIGYVSESSTLEWINDAAVVTSVTANLNTAKSKIGTDNPGAIAILDTILTDLETQHGGASPSVNDEAYYLIKFNVIYLKDRL